MIGRSRKLEADRAKIAELEVELGYGEPETPVERSWREYYEQQEIDRHEASKETRLMVLGVLWVLGLAIWNPLCWDADHHSPAIGMHHHWVLWVTCAWDVPAAVLLLVGGLNLIGWLLTGRHLLLGRWL